MRDLDYSIISKPFDGNVHSGDWGMVYQDDTDAFIVIIDVLGHGKEAQGLADICKPFFEENFGMDVSSIISALHEHIKGSRGCVATFCHLNLTTGILAYVSTGNTVLRKIGEQNEQSISQPGTIGYQIRTPIERSMTLVSGDVLILHTDGISSSMDEEKMSPITKDAETIAAYIMDRYGKQQDDALCIVLKYEHD